MRFEQDRISDEELKNLAEEFDNLIYEIDEHEKENGEVRIPCYMMTNVLNTACALSYIDEKKNNKINISNMRAATFFIAFLLTGVIAIGTNAEALREHIFGILPIKDTEGGYVTVRMVEKGSLSEQVLEKFPKDWEYVFYPEYLPDGYKLERTEELIYRTLIFYKSENPKVKMFINFGKIDSGKLMINSEDSSLGHVYINGNEGFYSYSDEGDICLVWTCSGYQFDILCNENLETAKKMAERVVYINLK